MPMGEVRGITVGHECPGKTKWVDPKEVRGTVAQFRKKPIVIEAIVAASAGEIETLEGVMTYDMGDFIITGIAGEKYPCKREIFLESYEPVDYDAQVLIKISNGLLKADRFYEDFPREEELKVDPLEEQEEPRYLVCSYCPAREKLYPWAVPQTTDTVMLCRKCWEKEAHMTVEEMWPLNEKSEKEG